MAETESKPVRTDQSRRAGVEVMRDLHPGAALCLLTISILIIVGTVGGIWSIM